ncbi:hypothetical protein D7Y13_12915 [Corallococcus praedator]|uniref:Uncharacterized protein n=1 Tax=Corallococcus praedator TaxID=2316724 RepID=A0ABX9QJF1_9BACT|nr:MULTISPECIES: hypothetical protein [Corallococcus]RKH19993.1 hypothetical protein D7X74_05260 [Corallococcus sp. CA047B]RKH34506.1 hypothetical protein D7X75_08010 [Corallococcus sp. CA031C]RKI10247.1 hypothetical protein D7Y13_12915 [Corallococcus praedator]
MADKKHSDAKPVKHVQATRPEPWPGIQGRSKDHEEELDTDTKRAEQSSITDEQRKLEDDVESDAKTRE